MTVTDTELHPSRNALPVCSQCDGVIRDLSGDERPRYAHGHGRCQYCGQCLGKMGRRGDRRYCCGAHRQRAYRQRQRAGVPGQPWAREVIDLTGLDAWGARWAPTWAANRAPVAR